MRSNTRISLVTERTVNGKWKFSAWIINIADESMVKQSCFVMKVVSGPKMWYAFSTP